MVIDYQPPVIVVHAITGSVLRDEYPVSPEVVWNPAAGWGLFGKKEFERIAMHPEDLRYEAAEPARVKRGEHIGLIYHDLIESLRWELSWDSEHGKQLVTPVFPFSYDWRQDNETSARELGAFIEEVIDRTNLLRHYARRCKCVDLVGHSMGGIVIGTCVAQGFHRLAEGTPRVRRVVTLGTPFRGSVDAVEKLTTGESEIVGSSSNRERESARVTPALYQLLPGYAGSFIDERGAPLDIYDAKNWQPSIVDSMAQFLLRYSTHPELQVPGANAARVEAAFKILQGLLTRAQGVQDQLGAILHPKTDLLEDPSLPLPWLVIAGEDERTLSQVKLGGDRRFHTSAVPDDDDGLTPIEELHRRALRGDGTVPLPGAIPDWAEPSSVVAVSRKDFAFGEVRDRVLSGQIGLHSALPLMNVVQRWTASFLLGRPTGELFGRRIPWASRWAPPFPSATERR